MTRKTLSDYDHVARDAAADIMFNVIGVAEIDDSYTEEAFEREAETFERIRTVIYDALIQEARRKKLRAEERKARKAAALKMQARYLQGQQA